MINLNILMICIIIILIKENLIYSPFEENIDYINKNIISFIKNISLSDISKMLMIIFLVNH